MRGMKLVSLVVRRGKVDERMSIYSNELPEYGRWSGTNSHCATMRFQSFPNKLLLLLFAFTSLTLILTGAENDFLGGDDWSRLRGADSGRRWERTVNSC